MSELNTKDYIDALSGTGPRASDWADKPHRLIYDLCCYIEDSDKAKRELLDEVIENLKANLDTKMTSWIQTTAELEVVVLDDAISLIEQMQQELKEG